MLIYVAGIGGLSFSVNRAFNVACQGDRIVEQLRQQKKLVDQANRATSRFVAAASHGLIRKQSRLVRLAFLVDAGPEHRLSDPRDGLVRPLGRTLIRVFQA